MADEWEHIENAVIVGGGTAAVVHVPIPNSNNLTVGLWTRDSHWSNPSLRRDMQTLIQELGLSSRPPNTQGSTSVLFVQSADGRKVLRLDWGVKPDGSVTYHWNRKKIPLQFTGVTNHQDANSFFRRAGPVLRVYRHAGRAMLLLGLAMDARAIYLSSNRPLQISRVVSGWAGAFAGCRLVGQGGAAAGGAVGTAFAGVGAGPGAAVGGIGGCLIGGVGGYWLGSEAGGIAYQWAEDTFFSPLEIGGADDFARAQPRAPAQ